LRVALLALPIVGIEFVGSVAFQALGKAWPSVVLTVTQRVVVLLVWVFALSQALGAWGVWWSFPVTDVTAMFLGVGALALVWLRVDRWGEADFNRRVGNFDIAAGG
jgi:Na+-driven multidrug efflux pump